MIATLPWPRIKCAKCGVVRHYEPTSPQSYRYAEYARGFQAIYGQTPDFPRDEAGLFSLEHKHCEAKR